MARIQLALNVGNLDEAVKFYTRMFGVGPAKVREGYANFAVDDPPLKLVLIEGHGEPGTLNHVGVEMPTPDEVTAKIDEARENGFPLTVQERTTCCFAVQDKVWIEGGELPWEWYTVLEDAPEDTSLVRIGSKPGVAGLVTLESGGELLRPRDVLLRRHLAEFVGTAFLVAAVVGSGIMATDLSRDVGVQLLANAVATGGALYGLIKVFGPVSGASFNPVVTLVSWWLDRAAGARVVMLDIAAQFAGATVGCWAANAMFSRPLFELSTKERSGGPQWFAEVVATVGLIVIIRGGTRARADVAALVAWWIVGAYWFTSSTSIANPAVGFGRMFSDSFAGIEPGSWPMFALMQLVGGACAVVLVRGLFGKE